MKSQSKLKSYGLKKKSFWSLKAKVEEVKYPITGEYNDDSKSILNEIGVHNDANDVAHDADEELK